MNITWTLIIIKAIVQQESGTSQSFIGATLGIMKIHKNSLELQMELWTSPSLIDLNVTTIKATVKLESFISWGLIRATVGIVSFTQLH